MSCTAKKSAVVADAEQRLAHRVQLEGQPADAARIPKLSAARSSPSALTPRSPSRENRHETRTVKVFRATQAVVATEWQSLIKLFVCVSRDALQRSAKDGLWSSTSEVPRTTSACR